MAGPTVDDLHAAMGAVAAFMERHALPEGPAAQVRAALREVAVGDAHGARRFLAIMGGKGPLDAPIRPGPGAADSAQEQERLQREWERLVGRANALAESLLRASHPGPSGTPPR